MASHSDLDKTENGPNHFEKHNCEKHNSWRVPPKNQFAEKASSGRLRRLLVFVLKSHQKRRTADLVKMLLSTNIRPPCLVSTANAKCHCVERIQNYGFVSRLPRRVNNFSETGKRNAARVFISARLVGHRLSALPIKAPLRESKGGRFGRRENDFFN